MKSEFPAEELEESKEAEALSEVRDALAQGFRQLADRKQELPANVVNLPPLKVVNEIEAPKRPTGASGEIRRSDGSWSRFTLKFSYE